MGRTKSFVQKILKSFKQSSGKGDFKCNVEEPVFVLRREFYVVCLFFLIIILSCFGSHHSEGQIEEDWDKIAAEEQRHFLYETLAAATKDFHHSHELGQGFFGPIYRVTFLRMYILYHSRLGF